MSRSKVIGSVIDTALDSLYGKKKKKKLEVSVDGHVKTEPTARALALGAGAGAGYEFGSFALSAFGATLFDKATDLLGEIGLTIGSFLGFAWDVRQANKAKRAKEKEIEEYAAKEARFDHVKWWESEHLQQLHNYRDSTGMYPEIGYSDDVIEAFKNDELDILLTKYIKKGGDFDLGINPFARPPVKFGKRPQQWGNEHLPLNEHEQAIEDGEIEDGYDYIERKQKEVANEKAQQK